MTKVPLVDLHAQHVEIRETLMPRVEAVLEQGQFILGPDVDAFEQEFAAYCGARHCVGVASGTDAIELALRAMDVGPGDEVVLPANTFIATALAVARAGARPVLVDCDPEYALIDAKQAVAAFTDRTRAVIPVHLFGQIAYDDGIVEHAASKGIGILADAAQAQGARRDRLPIGEWAPTSATSFYPAKNIGAYGDAGAVVTQSDQVAARVKALRNYGSPTKYHHPELGFNSRLDTLQAVVLSEKLKRLDAWNAARRRAAANYDTLFSGVPGVTLPRTLTGNEHVFHLYVIHVLGRDAVLKHLQDAGIGAGVHYPVPIHLQGALAGLGHRPGDFPVAEKLARTALSLPLHPHITGEQQEIVVDAVRTALGRT